MKDRQGRRSCVGPNWAEPRQVMAHLRPTGRAGTPERGRTRPPRPQDRRMVRPRRPRRSPSGSSHRPTATSLLLLRSRRAWGGPQVPWTPGAATRVGAGRGRDGSTCRRRTLPVTLRGVEYLHRHGEQHPRACGAAMARSRYWLCSWSARSMRRLTESSGFNAAARIWSNNDRYCAIALGSSK
jgi:hypothetical protein